MSTDIKQLKGGEIIAWLHAEDTEQQIIDKVVKVRPSHSQIAWQELEFIAFIHFGVNTYTNQEWGDGTESPEIFNPVDFDAEQWIKAIRDAEMKAVILTCKHHDGFCLWPSKYTEHSVKNSPWKNGKGDIVREISDACKKYGIKLGVYLSPWDRHEPTYGDSDTYNHYYKQQLTELLTEYGEVIDVWLDGACAEGPNGKKQVYDWRGFYEVARKLTPDATITGMGPDVRWCGNEAGTCRENEWSPVPIPTMTSDEADESDTTACSFPQHNFSLAMTEDLGSRNILIEHAKNEEWVRWYPAQVNTSIRPGWFYHTHEDHMVKSLKHLMDVYYKSVGGNAQFLLNLPPTPAGLIHEMDVKRLAQVGEVIRKTFSHNLADYATVTTTNTETEQILTLSFNEPVTFNTLMLQEDITQGQRVEAFCIEIGSDHEWQEIAKGTVIGYKKLIRLDEEGFITASQIRIVITQARALPIIHTVGVFKAPILVAEPQITRSKEGLVTILPRLDADIYYTVDGTSPTPESLRYTGPFMLSYGGTVKAIAYYKETSDDFYIEDQTIASQTFGVSKQNWQVVASSGNEVVGFDKENAIDENPHNYLKTSSCPYSLDIDMGETLELSGLHFMPVQEGYDFNYNTYVYSFSISNDGINWHPVKQEASFGNIYHNPVLQIVTFDNKVSGRYIRFEAVSGMQGKEYAVIREISVTL